MRKYGGIGLFIILAIIGFSLVPIKNGAEPYHTEKEIAYLYDQLVHRGGDTTPIFATSGVCENCHSTDGNFVAMLDADGNDVSMFKDWRATMMANSARDPFWRAKVSHESKVNPHRTEEIEGKCTVCHAPMGNYMAQFDGAPTYSIADLLQDTFGIDGVSCGICHEISADNIGNQNSGKINFDTSRVIYGPHLFPFEQPMLNFVGYQPVYGIHTLDAGLCASCHTLVTETVDLNGDPTGGTFVEQATYHEWLNSRYDTEDITCQGCHMPVLDESVIIAGNAPNLVPRSPYGLHELAGANTFMLELMKTYRDTLDIPATEAEFDSTIASTFKMLQEKSLNTSLIFLATEGDTASFKMRLENMAGHKFPSGYPSRRAYIEFKVTDEYGSTLFHSGEMAADYTLPDRNDEFEPHYDVITSDDQVQIYEIVNGDVNGNFTTVLERADEALKDNRLTPQGFTKSHMVYDTTSIVGFADSDPNFNIDAGVEGSGADEVTFKVGLNGFFGMVNVEAKVYYQSLPPHWMEEMFNEDTPEIALFKEMYNAVGPDPVLVSEEILNEVFVGTSSTDNAESNIALSIFPNPTADYINLKGELENINRIQIINQNGLVTGVVKNDFGRIEMPNTGGIYILSIELKTGTIVLKKVLKI